MAKAPTREPEEKAEAPPDKTPFERMTELTRRIFAVPKSEVEKPKQKPRG